MAIIPRLNTALCSCVIVFIGNFSRIFAENVLRQPQISRILEFTRTSRLSRISAEFFGLAGFIKKIGRGV